MKGNTMKAFLTLLMLLALPAFGQEVFFQYKPLVSTVTVDSGVVTSGSRLVYFPRINYVDTANVVAGIRIQGAGIPYGATIDSLKASGDSIYISSAATATDTLALVSLGYFLSSAYASGETMGWPFIVNDFKKINSVTIVDDAATVATGITAVFFQRGFTATMDTIAFAPSDADMEFFSGLMTLSVINTWGANKVITQPTTTLPIWVKPISGNRMYCQLVAGGTATFTAINNLTVKITGE